MHPFEKMETKAILLKERHWIVKTGHLSLACCFSSKKKTKKHTHAHTKRGHFAPQCYGLLTIIFLKGGKAKGTELEVRKERKKNPTFVNV